MRTTPSASPAAPIMPIPSIQGPADASPVVGTTVTTSGIVTGVAKVRGPKDTAAQPVIFIQDPAGDGDVHTSDAIAIRTGAPFTGHLGDAVQVTGAVTEIDGMTTVVGSLALATARRGAGDIQPIPVTPPDDAAKAATWLEAREGMLGAVNGALVLAPTASYGTLTVADAASHGPAKDLDGTRAGSHINVTSDGGVRIDAGTGDRVQGIVGPIDQSRGEYRIVQQGAQVQVRAGGGAPRVWGDLDGDGTIAAGDVAAITGRAGQPATGPLDPADLDGDGAISPKDASQASQRARAMADASAFTVASVNAQNLFDTVDDPARGDTVVSEATYQAKLGKLASLLAGDLKLPTIVGLQEIENENVLKDLVAQPALRDAGYGYKLIQGPDFRGINVALLYRAGVEVSNVRQAQGATKLQDKFGKSDPEAKLFARPPLVADVVVPGADGAAPTELTVMVNHFMSKYSPGGRPTEPWRVEQAQFVRDLAAQLSKQHPERGVLAMGDLNDHDSSAMMRILTDPVNSPLVDVGQAAVPRGERYTYQYRGSSDAIDHILITKPLADRLGHAGVHHLHADRPAPKFIDDGTGAALPDRATDHDILSASFRPVASSAPTHT